MRAAVLTRFAIGAVACCVLSCGQPRPGVDDARADFEKAYPGVAVSSVRVTEDEVIARSFEIRYRRASSAGGGAVGVQYLEQRDGSWKISPALPASLP